MLEVCEVDRLPDVDELAEIDCDALSVRLGDCDRDLDWLIE